ncbi:hypothetical protein N7465_001563 [Penicillium sp. CMV-2018d]|nr:hypothetical protein N7465_001563 [Penicillium sp. CMV-2018d]
MSLEGRYRSLLYETCWQIPNIILRLFPEFWQSSNSGLARICFDEVKEAFNRLIQQASSSKSYFCFFIDGLDEFEGDEVDHWRLSQDLKSWTTQAENVKLCLTQEDIFNFSVAMFEKDPNFHRVKDVYKDLVTEVVEASDGVFLWASLAMRSLLKSVGYQGSEKYLKRKLHLMPKRLDELFDQILGSIDPDDQLLSDQVFLLTTSNFCSWQPIVRNAIAYSWLEVLDDPGFPHELQMRPYTETEINERLERASCVLDRLSRGMLEMTRKRSHEIDGHDYISYEVHLGSFSAAVPATTFPKAIVSVWLIFLYGVVEGYLLAGSTEDSAYRFLEFLNQDVDQDVQLPKKTGQKRHLFPGLQFPINEAVCLRSLKK